jgi:Family of unknown function (DUF6504)
MRRYDDPVDVRRGQVPGPGDDPVEGPEQFLWKGRLWKVHAVLAQWVETGPWWQSRGVHAVLGAEDWDEDEAGGRAGGGTERGTEHGTEHGDAASRAVQTVDLGAECDVWRVEAGRGPGIGRGVFDLVFDWADGSWRLTRCLD